MKHHIQPYTEQLSPQLLIELLRERQVAAGRAEGSQNFSEQTLIGTSEGTSKEYNAIDGASEAQQNHIVSSKEGGQALNKRRLWELF